MSQRGKRLGGLNIHRPRGAGKPSLVQKSPGKLDLDVKAVLRSRFFAADFARPDQADLVTDAEYGRVTALAEDLHRGRITLPEFRAGLRGEA